MRCRTLQGFEVLIVACLKCLKVEGAITYKLQILVKSHGISKFIPEMINTIETGIGIGLFPIIGI